MDGLRYSPDDPYYRLGPVHTCLYVRVRETGDWDIFLGPLEWARAETGGPDRWALQRRGFPGVARVYSPPRPWDTHYQFSTKTLLSKSIKARGLTLNTGRDRTAVLPTVWGIRHFCGKRILGL